LHQALRDPGGQTGKHLLVVLGVDYNGSSVNEIMMIRKAGGQLPAL